MDDRGVVASSQKLSDGIQRMICHILAQVHGDLSGLRHIAAAGLGHDLVHRDTEMFRDFPP